MKPRNAILLLTVIFYTWLHSLIIAGTGIKLLQKLTLTGLFGFILAFGISFPVKTIVQNLASIEETADKYQKENRDVLSVTVPVFILSSLGFVFGFKFPLSEIVNLTFRSSFRIFLPLRQFYSDLLGTGFSSIIFNYSRFYLHFLWIYLITGLISDSYGKIKSLLNLSENPVEAKTVPFTGGKNSDILAEIYVVTGRHGLFRIPEAFCKECNLFYRSVEKASDQTDENIDIEVKSYWTRFLRPLLKGGWHPPVLLVNGEVFSQGYEVPDEEELVEKFREIKESG